MSKVFVTGASGFIAKHILRELFEKGYEVRASIRSDKRRDELEALYPGHSLEFAFLDLDKDDGWDTAMDGCDVLMHTASPFVLDTPKDPQELIRPAVQGTLRAMNAAKAAGIKRVVLTSSCAAIYKDASKSKAAPSDETNWTTPNHAAVSPYEASKTLAEKAAWNFVAENPDMALTTINPGGVFGTPMDDRYGASLELIERMISGAVPVAPPLSLPMVDVRDVAFMHVAAIDNDAAKGERFAAAADTLMFVEAGKILRDWNPASKAPKSQAPGWLLRILALFNAEVRELVPSLGMNLAVSGAKAEKVLGFAYVPVKDSLIASAETIKAKMG